MIKINAAARLKAVTRLEAAKLEKELEQTFYKELQKADPVFKGWESGISGMKGTTKSKKLPKDQDFAGYKAVVSALAKMGWEPKGKGNDWSEVTFVRANDEWPLVITLSYSPGLKAYTITIKVVGDRIHEPEISPLVQKVIKAQGLKITKTEKHADLSGTSFDVKTNTAGAQALQKALMEAISKDYKSNPDAYKSEPLSKGGPIKLGEIEGKTDWPDAIFAGDVAVVITPTGGTGGPGSKGKDPTQWAVYTEWLTPAAKRKTK